MALRIFAVGVAFFALLAEAVRVVDDVEEDEEPPAPFPEPTPSPLPADPLDGHGHCCCKDEPCTIESVSDNKQIESVYSPNQNMCCKMKKRTCGHWLQVFSGYRDKPPTEDYCNIQTPQDKPWMPAPELPEAPSPAPVWEPGTVGHTVHEYCNFSRHVEFTGDEDQEAAARHKIVHQLVEQLEENSIDAMAKSMFSVYMCVRWAPTGEFQDMAQGEMTTEQIDEKTVLQHYEDFTFMPLKCSMNMHVYDTAKELNQTFFAQFEAEMDALSDWFVNEQDSAAASRLRDLSQAREDGKQTEVEDLSRAFDLPTVREIAGSCDAAQNNGKVLVNVRTATSEQLFADCAGTRWWLTKLSDWHRAFAFSTFMTPKNIAVDAKPESQQQVLLCFGKRVASQLHRRKNGAHLMTDQSTVGCHGFYDFKLASQMVGRIVRLWRPPTCQLAAMELDFKVKILEMMDSMNDALFDALPSMIMEEETGQENFDGTKMAPAGALGTLAGMWKAIAERFNLFQTTYTRLGKILGATTVKWVVCPLNTITDQEDLDTLDQSLGEEDHVARYYSVIANAEHTGADLPGTTCEVDSIPSVPRAKRCSLGQMRENMPEPYGDEEFLCPVVPLLPAQTQLEVFQRKEGDCMLHMSLEQLVASHWYYRGHTPSQKQYNVTENLPSKEQQAMKIISFRNAVDDKFNIYRTFVKFGVGCTETENEITPRWCGPPTIFNDGLSDRNLLTNLPIPGAEGEGISNTAAMPRFTAWLYRTVKGMESSIRRTRTEWLGRAKDRYAKLYAKSFVETEMNELLHSLTYQSKVGDTGGDQSGKEYYDRYAVTIPCVGFEPERLFALKNTWAEYGYQLARKAKKHYNDGNAITNSRAFHIDLRGEALLHVVNEENSYLSYFTHMRAFALGASETSWRKTDNPILTQLSGALDPVLAANLRATSTRGFRATFSCGTKRQMHDLTIEGLTSSDPNLPASFSECVDNGIATNQQLAEDHPSAIFLEEQVVVRMTIEELRECFKQVDPDLVQNANETENHVYRNFLQATAECTALTEIPEEVASLTTESTYRGLLLGKGTPPDTLQEVLLDPAGFKAEAF